MKRTILYDKHIALGAKMAPFGGYEMPIQYEGIIREHQATRTGATVFDTCHMGEFRISGATALDDLENILSCRVSTMRVGQCRYGFICNGDGGVIDDQIVYRISESEFFMVVNASTEPADFAWVAEHVSSGTTVENLSATTGKIDLQGPQSPRIMQKLLEEPIADMKYYTFKDNRYRGAAVLTSRTGYTGEIGFELYGEPELIRTLWDKCLELGALPAGLGARDTLRLEMGFPLYGHELSAAINAAESGFDRAIARDKQFIGSGAVLDTTRIRQHLVGVRIEGRRAARQGDALLTELGERAGVVTSGSFSPTLQCALALGYVGLDHATPGTTLRIVTERQELKGTVAKPPFYAGATGRADLATFL